VLQAPCVHVSDAIGAATPLFLIFKPNKPPAHIPPAAAAIETIASTRYTPGARQLPPPHPQHKGGPGQRLVGQLGIAQAYAGAGDQQRLNKALRVGRVPNIVVKTLNALEAAGLEDHFLTIGTHALYAFESACGVRCLPGALATQDIDLLFDSRKRMAFVSQMKRLDSSFIGALRKADPSFRVMQDQKQTAINDTGFEVDVIRRMAIDGDPHPFRMSDDENDMWAVQVEGANRMLSAHKFSQVVVAETGHMAVMHTMDPPTFVAIKRMISKAPGRDPKKRLKDALQADLVEQLMQTHMPQYVAGSGQA
jgi:hypothetical protein